MIREVTVIGAGTMGKGIAQVFAQTAYKVRWLDISKEALDNGYKDIVYHLDKTLTKRNCTEKQKKETLDNLSLFTEVKKAVSSVELVIEAITENEKAKLEIFREIDAYAPKGCILASNTSSISITKIASATRRPEQVIGMHFMNPVPVMPLVEIIKGYSTARETFNTAYAISKTLGKSPVEANDYPGFVANRILMPMINEAIEVLRTGIAGVEEIDAVMKLGMAHPMGPLQLADFIGLDICLAILEVMYDGFKNPKYAPNPLLIKMVTAGKLGVKSREGFYDYSENKKAERISRMFS
ncbi:MAG: 3-hydroxybutyryl-CoA dehydrogenase [Bergeyella sp.]|nr:3-hydroxybutyryl-CoA dehydrogenase [Bergeyella sp.]